MTAGSQSHLNAIRDFLLEAFSASELDELFFFADNPKLRTARDAHVSADGKTALAVHVALTPVPSPACPCG